MKRIIVLSGLLALAILTSACQTHIGSGSLKLSNNAAKSFERYLEYPDAQDFAISPTRGRTFFMYCSDGPIHCKRQDSRLIRLCNERNNTDDCKILALKQTIVWDSPGNFMPYYSAIVVKELGQSYFGASDGAVAKTKGGRYLKLKWAGYETAILTDAAFDPNGRSGSLEIADKRVNLSCDGGFTYDASGYGIWSLNCNDNITAEGKIIHDKEASAASRSTILKATGTDSQNRKISYKIIIKS